MMLASVYFFFFFLNKKISQILGIFNTSNAIIGKKSILRWWRGQGALFYIETNFTINQY